MKSDRITEEFICDGKTTEFKLIANVDTHGFDCWDEFMEITDISLCGKKTEINSNVSLYERRLVVFTYPPGEFHTISVAYDPS